MELDFKGRVNNTKVPNSSGLDTVLEAVVNSIQAMDPDCENPRIDIKLTSSQMTVDGKQSSIVTGFVISDNGIGFTEDNFQSFRKVDSTYKFKLGCKGIGRLSWLKVFSDVKINSVYKQGGTKYQRCFSFNLTSDGVDGGNNPQITDLPIHTEIHLENCLTQYQESIQHNPKAIATKIFDHCLAYFLHGDKQPVITVSDSEGSEIVNEIYNSTKDRIIHPDPFEFEGYQFDIYHVRFRTLSGANGISLCANDLEVRTPHKFDRSFIDEDGQIFRYMCFVYSPLLDAYVNPSRDGFDLGEKNRTLPDFSKPSIKEIIDKIRPICEEYLKPFSDAYYQKCSIRLRTFTESESGRMFSAAVKYDPLLITSIKPDMSDSELYQKCSESQSKIESELLFKPVTDPKKKPIEDSVSLNEHYQKITTLQKDQLAKLITHRGIVLSAYEDRLEAIKKECIDDEVKFEYELESVIHDLILPRGTDRKNQAIIETCNLWIVDERLEYYAYFGAYSDKKLCDISNNDSKLRPDVYIFGDITDSMEAKSACIIEFKRPNRKDSNIIDQIYDYIDAIKNSEIQNYRGVNVSITDNTVFYCYAICSTESKEIKTLVKRNHMKSQFGDRGFFVWNQDYNCSLDLIDHHKVFSDAKIRNKVFFSIIGLEVSSDAVVVNKGHPMTISLNSDKK